MWQIIINGPGYFDTTYDLPEGITNLGRADENDIVLSGDLVSRRHARFKVAGDAVTVEDLGSRNGSRLNGEPLQGPVTLKPGDTVAVGENSLAVRRSVVKDAVANDLADLSAGGVKRYGRGNDIGGAVIIARDIRESVVLRALDNIAPFDAAPGLKPFDDATRQVNHDWLLVLYKIAEKLASATSLQEFLEEAADRVMDRARATTAVVLVRHATGAMIPAAVRHRGTLAKGEVPVSDAIIDAALEKGAALAVQDVRDDKRFQNRESVILYGADQVLCIPIKSGQRFSGALYLNRPAGDTEELNHVLDLCTAVTHLLATGIDKFGNVQPHEVRLRRALERFHAPHIVERRAVELAKAGGGPLTQMEARGCTLLFADIAGFTQLTEKVPPEKIVEILNEFYQRMTGIVFSFEGTVDKFLGDEVMAIFGAPYSRGDDAVRAVRTALAMRAEWAKTMNRFPEALRCPLRIGLNTGKVLAGTVGSDARLDYTAVGEPVNVAAWLASTATPGQVLMTGKTLAAVGARFDVTPLGERGLPGATGKLPVFEVLEEDVAQLTNPGQR